MQPNRITGTLTEYEVRLINKDGDAEDVLQWTKLKRAKKCAAGFILPTEDGIVALVIEKIVKTFYASGHNREEYTVLASAGDREALKAGGWIE